MSDANGCAAPAPTSATPAAESHPMRLAALVAHYGFPTTAALKKWLQRRDLPLWRDGADLWADRAVIDAHIQRERTNPTNKPAPLRDEPRDDASEAREAAAFVARQQKKKAR